MFADWRTGLDFIPLLTFFLLIVIFFISGIFSGYKKALYYGIFNVIFFLIGWIITIELGDRIINWILSFFTIDQSIITNDEIVQLVKPFLGIILYFIFAFFGYLLIGLPLYQLIFAKLFRMGKYDKKSKKYLEYCKKHNIKPEIYTKKDYKKYRVLSRSFGGIFSLLLNVQNICITTELAYVGSTQSITIKSNKLQQSIFNLTNSFNNLFTGYTDNLYEDASSAIAALQLLQNDPDTGTPLYNCLFTPIQDLINGVTKYVNAPIFTLEQVTSIENLFNNFQFSQEEKLTKYLNDLVASDDYYDIYLSLLKKNITFDTKIKYDQFVAIQKIFHTFINGSMINISTSGTSYTINEYKVNPSNFKKLKVNEKVLNFISDLFIDMFDSSSGTPEQIKMASKSLFGVFFDIEPPKTLLYSVSPCVEFNKEVAQITSITDLFPSQKNNFIFASGIEQNPYLIPLQLFYVKDQQSGTISINDSIIPTNMYNWWSFFVQSSDFDYYLTDLTYTIDIDKSATLEQYISFKTTNHDNTVLPSFGVSHLSSPISLELYNSLATTPIKFKITVNATNSSSIEVASKDIYFQLAVL